MFKHAVFIDASRTEYVKAKDNALQQRKLAGAKSVDTAEKISQRGAAMPRSRAYKVPKAATAIMRSVTCLKDSSAAAQTSRDSRGNSVPRFVGEAFIVERRELKD